MIKNIHFNHYRKLKNIDISFSPNVNIISGTNGTCKSSILHIISNSFQVVKPSQKDVEIKKCIATIRAINDQYNPKLESLTRGDKLHSDPAPGHSGPYYSVDYWNSLPTLSFRKHNSQKDGQYRYAVKPKYSSKCKDSLPAIPVIYLGLNRLVTYGEYRDNEPITGIKQNLPEDYLSEIVSIYKSFTNYDISHIVNNHMGSVKIRADFESSATGIDSNTISAGEDNLYIILLALVSLKYYYDTICNHNEVDSILLIDEFDATLHPAFQSKLFDLVMDYSIKYKIQVVFTSHSLFLLEYCLKCKQNLLYLYDNQTSVKLLTDPSIYKINMYLRNVTKTEYAFEKRIPVFTEDAEARYLLTIIFDYFSEKYEDFKKVRNYFYLVDANIGGDTLHSMFKDAKLKTFTGQFCILDGDKAADLTNRVITLPGKASPELFLIDYAKMLYDKDSCFWTSDEIMDENLGKPFYLQTFVPAVQAIDEKIAQNKEDNISTKGIKREKTKVLFNNYKKFFHILFDAWLADPDNFSQIDTFYCNLKIMFKQVAAINCIDPSLWD